MSTALTSDHKKQLERWITTDKTIKFTLLYRASRDGCSSTAFHQKCDNKGPTVTIFYNTNKTVYGGYASASWNSREACITDYKAFLFRLTYNGDLSPLKFPVYPAKTAYALCGYSAYGPVFGGNSSYDISSFNGTLTKSENHFAFNGSLKLGSNYDMHGHNADTLCNGHQNIEDFEVYGAEEQALLQKPWRRNVDWNFTTLRQLKDHVVCYEPLPELNITKSRILLVGQVGAGKSSFFNTINSIFRGYVSSQANSGSTEHSLTTVFRMYQIRNLGAGESLNFRLCDTRGLEENQGLDAQELGYILDGHVPDGHQFNPAAPLSSDIIGFVKNPKLGDRIQCVVFVIDGSAVDVINEKVLQKIKNMQASINQKDIPQVVLLTKVDKICLAVAEDVSAVFSSPAVRECVDKVAHMVGLPRTHVLPFKNYECEIELDDNINLLALLSMKTILNFTNDHLYNHLDRLEEGKGRASNKSE